LERGVNVKGINIGGEFYHDTGWYLQAADKEQLYLSLRTFLCFSESPSAIRVPRD